MTSPRPVRVGGFATLAALVFTCALGVSASAAESKGDRARWLKDWRANNPVWRGVHLPAFSDAAAAEVGEALPMLKAVGMNVLVLEVDCFFEFAKRPDLRGDRFVTRARAGALATACRERGIRLIPQFNCLGHQSEGKRNQPLLARHPEYDETPGQFPDNQGIYCRSWCPQAPGLMTNVTGLIDEILEAFQADAFHVGMDEVFFIASEHCPRCKGGNPAQIFARAVNDLHAHIVGKRKCEMLMWGDRLLDAKALGYSKWEASENGTAPAVDLIPKDIIICDWHYDARANYPSVPYLLEKGFRVWPAGWQPLEAARAFSRFAKSVQHPNRLGYLATTWGKVRPAGAAEWPPVMQVLREWE